MTERTIRVCMTAGMAEAICAYVDDQRKREPDKETIMELDHMDAVALTVIKDLNVMNAATVLYDDVDITVFEDPIRGDEATVLAYLKEDRYLERDTLEFDGDKEAARRIFENHNQAFHI